MIQFTTSAPGLPSDSADAEASMAAGERQRDPGALLLAEDNPVNAKVAVAMLESAGYRVVTVVNGGEAVAAMAAEQYVAVLMDCQMPTMDGYEATERIRAGEPRGFHTPIIAMTAGVESVDRPRCLSVGMDDYLTKPVQKDHLLSVLRRWTGVGNAVAQVPACVPRPTPEEILDLDTMAHLRSLGDEPGSEGLLEELFQLFFAEVTRHLADLHAALSRADSHSVAFIAHTIKGSAAEFGARRLVLACSDLVSMGVAGRLEGAGAMLREVEEEYELARRALLRSGAAGAPEIV